MRKQLLLSIGFLFWGLTVPAQQLLTLDSCRAMALRNNKQLDASRLRQEVAKNMRRSMRTKYLPHVSALGTYQYTSEEISLLNNEQKTTLSNLGSIASLGLQSGVSTVNDAVGKFSTLINTLHSSPAVSGALTQMSTDLQQNMQNGVCGATDLLNTVGQKIVDAFDTDTRHLWAGSVMAVQPVFMGGSIIALNKMADLGEQMAEHTADASRQAVLYSVDQAYWQVVSLKHKKRLAESFLKVVTKLDSDVQKMIAEGVATKSDGLSVSVKKNEAEMAVQKVDNGLTLSKMLLCQMIGLPLNDLIQLADEDADNLAVVSIQPQLDVEQAIENRPELKLLDNSVAIAKQSTKLLRAGNLPMVALMGGYSVSNPSIYNGFERKFKGCWNVGVLVRVPLWNWGDVNYKVRASKGVAAIAALRADEAREKIELQVNQNTFRVDEANKRLIMANSSVDKADENLRMANLGFQEGVITPATVMEAQTAWLQAKSQQIDAQIEVRLSQVDLKKSLGTLQ